MPTIVFADTAAVATAAKSDLGWRKVEASGRITSADRKKGDEMDLRQNAATQRRSLASASISNSLRLFPLPLKRRQSYAIKSEECLLLSHSVRLSLHATCLWPRFDAASPREIPAIPDASYGKGSILR